MHLTRQSLILPIIAQNNNQTYSERAISSHIHRSLPSSSASTSYVYEKRSQNDLLLYLYSIRCYLARRTYAVCVCGVYFIRNYFYTSTANKHTAKYICK